MKHFVNYLIAGVLTLPITGALALNPQSEPPSSSSTDLKKVDGPIDTTPSTMPKVDPSVTPQPDASSQSEVTKTPDASSQSEVTETPDASSQSEVTKTPEVTKEKKGIFERIKSFFK